MSDLVIFDTSVLVDELRTGRHRQRIESVQGLVRTSSVVLAELWRGAVGAAERGFLRSLSRNHPILIPTEKNWLESGEMLARIRADHGFAPAKLRDLHFERPDRADCPLLRGPPNYGESGRFRAHQKVSRGQTGSVVSFQAFKPTQSPPAAPPKPPPAADSTA